MIRCRNHRHAAGGCCHAAGNATAQSTHRSPYSISGTAHTSPILSNAPDSSQSSDVTIDNAGGAFHIEFGAGCISGVISNRLSRRPTDVDPVLHAHPQRVQLAPQFLQLAHVSLRQVCPVSERIGATSGACGTNLVQVLAPQALQLAHVSLRQARPALRGRARNTIWRTRHSAGLESTVNTLRSAALGTYGGEAVLVCPEDVSDINV